MFADILYVFLHRKLRVCSAIIASPTRNKYTRWRRGENIAQTPVAASAKPFPSPGKVRVPGDEWAYGFNTSGSPWANLHHPEAGI